MNNIEELRKQRGRLFAKRSLMNKKGLDVSEIEKALDDIRKTLASLSGEGHSNKSNRSTNARKSYRHTKKISSSHTSSNPAEYAKSLLKKWGWVSGKTFDEVGRSSMSINNIEIKDNPKKKQIEMDFTLMYTTKRHQAYNDVHWVFPYDKIKLFPNDIKKLRHDIQTQKTFTDKKFFRDKFDERDLSDKGWIVIK